MDNCVKFGNENDILLNDKKQCMYISTKADSEIATGYPTLKKNNCAISKVVKINGMTKLCDCNFT